MKVAMGTLLASAPDLRDPNFMHSLSIMCEHSDTGAYALVLNKRSSLTIDRLLPDHPILGQLKTSVQWGGPVENDTLQILHRFPEEIPGGVEICSGLVLGGDLDAIAAMLASDPAPSVQQGVRFVLGCAGWGPCQLEAEIDSGSWIPLAYKPEFVFGPDNETQPGQEEQWQAALRSLGSQGAELANMPPDIGWN